MKRRFRAVGCCNECASYSTLEKAETKLKEWAKKYGHDLVECNEEYPKEYQCAPSVKCWHNYVGISENGIQYSYVIVELKEEVK